MNISKRSFLQSLIYTPAAAATLTAQAVAAARHQNPNTQQASRSSSSTAAATTQTPSSTGPHKLPPLPYDFAALEPHIDRATMQLHHDKHHQTYVTNLNTALAKHPNLQSRTPEDLIRDMNSLPEDIRMAVRNNGGGHVNHTMFWQIMKPSGGGEPTGAIADAIKSTFNSFANFKTQFNDAGARRFGSGWVWLMRDGGGKLQIISTANQDNPLMEGHTPIIGNDVWEHAYYLKYNNRRPEYLTAWWNTVNWDEINRRFSAANR